METTLNSLRVTDENPHSEVAAALIRELSAELAVMLETGVLNVEALGLYQSAGYESIDCYGIYVGETISRCYRKVL